MNIFETICKVMGEVGAVGKDQKNQHQGFMYRGIDAVMNALNPAMVKYKLFVVPEVLEQTREEKTTKNGTVIYSICKIKYTFYAEDGSNIQTVVIGEAFDSGDKATNKAMSVAFKYACFQVFCIPTEEMKDPDAETHTLDTPKQEKSDTESKQPIKEGQKVDRLSLIKTFEDEIIRTGKSKKWFLDQAKVSASNFMKNEKLIEFIEILKKLPNKGEQHEQ